MLCCSCLCIETIWTWLPFPFANSILLSFLHWRTSFCGAFLCVCPLQMEFLTEPCDSPPQQISLTVYCSLIATFQHFSSDPQFYVSRGQTGKLQGCSGGEFHLRHHNHHQHYDVADVRSRSRYICRSRLLSSGDSPVGRASGRRSVCRWFESNSVQEFLHICDEWMS